MRATVRDIRLGITLLLFAVFLAAFAQAAKTPEQAATPPSTDGRAYSGMYTFLKEGEFVQVTVEDGARVTGFISRYGDGESDKGTFLNQFFKTAKLEGTQLSFITKEVHGTWFEFKGTVERGEGKNPGDEAYYVLKGSLVESKTDASKNVTSHSRDVVLKAFPAEASK